MWSIVVFKKDNSVAAVPSHWFKNGKCAWPKDYIKNKNKLVEKRSLANALEFNFYSARKLYTEHPIGIIILIIIGLTICKTYIV